MKFKIRFADKIVGLFVIFSLLSLAFAIVMLGRSQRWFAKDAAFSTILPSAGGLSKNMAVQYRGFTIGSIKDFYLTDNDEVKVDFVIHEKYKSRVRLGSMVELNSVPIIGGSFQFHPGLGEELAEGSFVPVVGSAQAKELISRGLATEHQQEDVISSMLNSINSILAQLDEALGVGSDVTEIGQIIGSVQKTLSGVESIPDTLERTINDIRLQIRPILANVNSLVAELNDPDGLIYTVLDTDKEVYTDLVKILDSVSSMLDSLDRTVAFIPGQLPQLAGLILDLRVTLQSAESAIEALLNNPLLKKGVPDRLETQSGDTRTRDIRF